MKKNQQIRCNMTFALGFKKVGETIVPFTAPETHRAIFDQLEKAVDQIDIVEAGDEFRMACRGSGEPAVTRGYLNFRRDDPRIRPAMRYRLSELAKLGAKQLKESVDLLRRAPIRESVEQFAEYCRDLGYLPHPDDLIIQHANELDEEENESASQILLVDGEPKLILPALPVPFPKTINSLMFKEASRLLTIHFNKAVIQETRGIAN